MILFTLIHWIIILLAPLYLLLQGSPAYYDLIIAFYVFISLHWSFFKNECIISYLNKKTNDCEYKLGSNPIAVDVRVLNSIPLRICDVISIGAMIFIAHKIGYSIPLFLVIVGLRMLPYSLIKDIAILCTSMYYLRDNKYLLPGLIIVIASSMIVKWHDKKKSCLRLGDMI